MAVTDKKDYLLTRFDEQFNKENVMKSLLIVIFSGLLSHMVLADPISDLSMKHYRSGWFPNFYQGDGPLSCAQACEKWVGAASEHEASREIDGQSDRADVCKVTRDKSIVTDPREEPDSHWLYGSQYDDYPVCFIHSLGYGSVQSKFYMCQCVEPSDPSPCPNPDLIVSTIYKPIWDQANGVTIVKVDVTNIGSSAAGSFTSLLKDPGTGATSANSIGGLGAGLTTTLTFTFTYWLYDPNAELEAWVDIKDEVKECDETNNQKTFFDLG
jgi:hypothetical protein